MRPLNALATTIAEASAASVMVSCKIPILATRVRFPGGANVLWHSINQSTL